MIEQGGKCLKCGTYHWEHDDGPAYEADGLLCHGCEALDTEKERRKDRDQQPGVHLVLYPKGGVTDGA